MRVLMDNIALLFANKYTNVFAQLRHTNLALNSVAVAGTHIDISALIRMWRAEQTRNMLRVVYARTTQ